MTAAGRARAAARAGLPPLLALLGLLAAWQALAILTRSGAVATVPSTLASLPGILSDPEALRDIAASLRRMTEGFLLAVALATPLGLLMGRSRRAAALLGPLLMASYPVPKAALMPLLMLWFGVGEGSKLLVIVLGVMLPVLFHAQQGAAAVDLHLLWSAEAMDLGAARRFLRVVLPAALPDILVGCRTGIVMALITMVTSEMITRQAGIGNLLFGALDMADYDAVYATILIIGLLGIGLDIGFEALRRGLTGWADTDGPPASRP